MYEVEYIYIFTLLSYYICLLIKLLVNKYNYIINNLSITKEKKAYTDS
jgi:hypothetical protein